MNSNAKHLLSKIATGNGHGENSPYFDGWKAFESNPFHPTKNPQGVIQMGLAENQVIMLISLLLIVIHYIYIYISQLYSWLFCLECAALFWFGSRVDSEKPTSFNLHPGRSIWLQWNSCLSGLSWLARVQKCMEHILSLLFVS